MSETRLNLYQICRLCLCELNGSSYVSIFDNKDSNLAHKIKSCFLITVSENDRLPNVLCPACTRDVERFYKFKEKVIKNNVFLKSYTYQRDRKTDELVQETSCASDESEAPMRIKRGCAPSIASGGPNKTKKPVTVAVRKNFGGGSSDSFEGDASHQFFDNGGNKVKVEILPQVANSSFGEGDSTANGSVTGDDRNSPIVTEYSFVQSPGSKSVNDDYGTNSSFDQFISVHVKDELGHEYDSEDTKSASSYTYKEEEEDASKLIIDEETSGDKDGCILLRTLIDASAQDRTKKNATLTKKAAVFSPQILVRDTCSPQTSSSGGSNTPTGERSSTRRKQKCPTRSDTALLAEYVTEDDEAVAELLRLDNDEAAPFRAGDVVNISPVTVTCSSNGKEEIIGYDQTHFVDEAGIKVYSRHNSPPNTPPMVAASQAERLHKACDVLLRAASKIQEFPPGVPQEVVVEEVTADSITLYPSGRNSNDGSPEPITLRRTGVPFYEVNNYASANAREQAVRKTRPREKSAKKECSNCHAQQTTIWRRDRFGNIVCNACGLYYKLHNYDRPCRMRRDEIHKRNRKRNPADGFPSAQPDAKIKKIKHVSYGDPDSPAEEIDVESTQYVERDREPEFYQPFEASVSYAKKRRESVDVIGRAVEDAGIRYASPIVAEVDYTSPRVVTQHEPQIPHSSEESEFSVSATATINGAAAIPLNHLFNEQDENNVTVATFQVSTTTHFVPINGKMYEDDDDDTEVIISDETPLNLAASSH